MLGKYGRFAHQRWGVGQYSFDRPIPPRKLEQLRDHRVWESRPDNPGRIADRDAIRRHILADNGKCTDHCAIAYAYARQDGCAVPHPHVVADVYVALCGRVPLDSFGFREHQRQGIGRDPIHSMLATEEDLHATGERAELTHSQLSSRTFEVDFRVTVGVATDAELAVAPVPAHPLRLSTPKLQVPPQAFYYGHGARPNSLVARV